VLCTCCVLSSDQMTPTTALYHIRHRANVALRCTMATLSQCARADGHEEKKRKTVQIKFIEVSPFSLHPFLPLSLYASLPPSLLPTLPASSHPDLSPFATLDMLSMQKREL
jgi:hypothetical protein